MEIGEFLRALMELIAEDEMVHEAEENGEEKDAEEEMDGDCVMCRKNCAECELAEEEAAELDEAMAEDEDEEDDEMKDETMEDRMKKVQWLQIAVPAGYVLRANDGNWKDLKVVRDPERDPLKVERVIFSKPATIVIWHDGTKTIVKCDKKDKYSKATGLALCFMKKALGNSSRVLNDALREANERAVVETEHDRLMKKAKKYQDKGAAQKKAKEDSDRKTIYTGSGAVMENRK